MQCIITQAGKTYLANNNGQPPVLGAFKLGASFNYTPTDAVTDIVGPVVYTGVPGTPIIVDTNICKDVSYIDGSSQAFYYGELGLY